MGNPIRVMLHERDETRDLLVALRELTAGYAVPDDACPSYQALLDGLARFERDLHLHIHKESNLLFPAALAREEGLADVS
ncbi:MAG: hemerythrin domain-containing protein [Acidimicrobiia bacterium]|nr:hemerythrin domain-containing protein [Acidimicrobiia bacterium]